MIITIVIIIISCTLDHESTHQVFSSPDRLTTNEKGGGGRGERGGLREIIFF